MPDVTRAVNATTELSVYVPTAWEKSLRGKQGWARVAFPQKSNQCAVKITEKMMTTVLEELSYVLNSHMNNVSFGSEI